MTIMPPPDNRLGAYLRDRRAKLDPAALGLPLERRRTAGLRREEVAQRAHISPTWYTWLEQGRGGAPSADVLDRIARALVLTEVEREHLFLIGLGRQPDPRYQDNGGVTPRLQRLLNALDPCPALIRTPTWDVLAWNQAATVILTDYGAIAPEQRNILKLIFFNPATRANQYDWESVARFALGAFRADVTRARAEAVVAPLLEELSAQSGEFRRLWSENEVARPQGDGVKHLNHPDLGLITFEHTVMTVDGRTDLALVTFNPTEQDDLTRIALLIDARATLD